MAPKVDPAELEREYVTSDISQRELARRHDMAWSTIAARARAHGWNDKRIAYREAVARKSYERVADRTASVEAEIRNEMVLTARATLAAYANDLRSGNIKVQPKDALAAVSTLLLLLGEPTSRSESKIVEFSTGGLDPDDLRELAKFARARIVEGAVADSPRPQPSESQLD